MKFIKKRRVKKAKQKLLNRTLNNFEIIYTTCHEIGSYYGNISTVKIPVIKMVCDMSKIGLEGSAVEIEFYIMVNRSIENIYQQCLKTAKKQKKDEVTFALLRHLVDLTKKLMLDGYNAANPQ